ncbi:MAG: hypothetical protein JEZ09_17900 [Salinivirgaceae bacterium]|nr:hypothetical protein [Salinivirgaceae bacterium]
MKADGYKKMPHKLISELSNLSDDELDILFNDAIVSDSMGFDGGSIKEAIRGISHYLEQNSNKFRAEICHNETIVRYISDNKSKNKTDIIEAMAALLIVYLPQIAAIVAAEKIIRIGLAIYCKNEISQNKTV